MMKTNKKEMSKAAIILLLALCVLWTVLVGALSRNYAIYIVTTDSMRNSLYPGDMVLVKTDSYDLNMGDVVLYRLGNKLQCKRIAALPGDEVDFDADGRLSVNGSIRNVSREDTDDSTGTLPMPYILAEKNYFMLGDDRAKSIDSRAAAIAGIEQKDICGKVLFRLRPLKGFGSINRSER